MYRLGLKQWLSLSRIRKELQDGVDDVVASIEGAITLHPDLPTEFETLSWLDAREAFLDLLRDNQIRIEFPITKPTNAKKSDDPPWEYPERDWYYWLHLLASNYGWTAEYIAKMDVEDAMGLLQEIETEAQLEKEFAHSLSELAYSYDKISKKSKYNPLARPGWMSAIGIKIKETIKRRKIPRHWKPPGVTIRVDAEEQIKDAESKTGI